MKLKAYFALTLVCLIWGTTYFFIKLGVDHFPPFAFLGIRHFIAGLLLIAFISLKRKNRILFSWSNIKPQILPGILLIATSNGVLGWVEQIVPSGLVAILFALVPVQLAIYNGWIVRQEHQSKYKIMGILMGFAGVLLIFQSQSVSLQIRAYQWGLLVALLATLSWSAGNIIGKQVKTEANAFFNSAIQLLSGGFVLIILSFIFDSWRNIEPFNPQAMLSMSYLILFGSLAGFISYIYALENLPVGQVTIHTYVNPLVAIILGWKFLNEPLNANMILASGLILSGVFLINFSYYSKNIRVKYRNI